MKQFDISETGKFAAFFKEHGWLHIQNVFSKQEIEDLRAKAYAMQAQNYKGDVLSFEPTSHLVTDDRIINILKIILDTDKPVYFGDSSGYNIGKSGGAGFHKDNPDKTNGQNPDWVGDYSLIRLGIYCQSHVNYSASVSLRDKSQNSVDGETGTPFYVNNNAGDLVIWSLRTSHSGNSLRLKFFPDVFVHPKWYNKLPKFLFKGEEQERIAYFMTYGKNDHHLRRYLSYLLNREYMVSSWKQSKYSPGIIEKVKRKKNIALIDMYEVVKDIDLDKVSKAHKEMPAVMEYFEPRFIE